MKYNVILYPSDQGFAVEAPDLVGCWSQGATQEEALENIGIAIQEYFEFTQEQTGNRPVIEPSFIRQIEVAI